MNRFAFLKFYGAPGKDTVALAVVAIDGPFKGQTRDLYTSQPRLAARNEAALRELGLTAAGGETAMPTQLRDRIRMNWGDDDAVAEARELLAALGGQLVDVCSHDVPIDEECASCSPVANGGTGARL